jgi:hypothetical protein
VGAEDQGAERPRRLRWARAGLLVVAVLGVAVAVRSLDRPGSAPAPVPASSDHTSEEGFAANGANARDETERPVARSRRATPSPARLPIVEPAARAEAPPPPAVNPKNVAGTTNAPRPMRALPREAFRPSEPEAAAKPSFGVLSVRSTPWARIALDGRKLGEGVVAGQPIPAGKHTLTITPGDPALLPRTIDVDIKLGVITKVVVDFRAGTVRIDPP